MYITVIIPSYKPKEYIWECLDSIKKQTFDKTQFEVIIILNGCKEPFHQRIKSYIDSNLTDNNIRLLQVDQAGVSNARNIGLDLAQGEYITFIDDDDYISPQYLYELYNLADKYTTPISYALAVDEGTQIISKYYITKLYDANFTKGTCKITNVRSYFSGPCMKLIHKNIIGKHRFDIKLANGEDSLFMFEISDNIKRISLTSRNAVYYRRYREGSAIMNKQSLLINIHCIYKYSVSYFTHIGNYNMLFFISRICAEIRDMIIKIKKNVRISNYKYKRHQVG